MTFTAMEQWLDLHQFASMGQALRQIMDHVEFGEDNDGQIIIHTNLTEDPTGCFIHDIDTGVSV